MEYINIESDFRPIGGYAELLIRKHRRIKGLKLDKQFGVKGNFNGIVLQVNDDSNVQSIVDYYYKEIHKREEK